MFSILLVDDHPAVMEGTKAMLGHEKDIVFTTVSSGIQALDSLKNHSFDLLLLDLHMPGLNGIDLIKAVLDIDPNAIILIYTGFNIKPQLDILMQAGISGFIPKTASKDQLLTAIRCAINGETVIPISLFRRLRSSNTDGESFIGGDTNSINEKELKILKYIAQAKSNKEIAEILLISQRTLEYWLTDIFQKLNVKSRKEAVAKSKEIGLIIDENSV